MGEEIHSLHHVFLFTLQPVYFNPRTPVFIKARQQSAGIKKTIRNHFLLSLLYTHADFLSNRSVDVKELGDTAALGWFSSYGFSAKGWCVPQAGRSLESFPSLESMVQHNPDFTHHFVQTYTRDSHPFADIGNLYLC